MYIKNTKWSTRFSGTWFLKQNKRADFKNFKIDYVNLIFERIEYYFLCGQLYKEASVSINDLENYHWTKILPLKCL